MSEKDAEEKHRKSRQYIVPGLVALFFGLLMIILLVLSIAGYIPPIPEEPEGGPYPFTPFTFGISSILIAAIGLYLMARGYRLSKFEEEG